MPQREVRISLLLREVWTHGLTECAIAYSESRAFERISKDEKAKRDTAIRHIFEKGSASYFKAKRRSRDKCIDVDRMKVPDPERPSTWTLH